MQARQPDSWEGWYWGAKHVWGMRPGGPAGDPSAQPASWTSAENSDAVLFWGCDPETTPWGWGGQHGLAVCCFWFTEIGVKQIYICARRELRRRRARRQVDPGAAQHRRGAAAGHRLRVDRRRAPTTQEYVDTHAVGFDWFEYYVHGRRGRRSQDARSGPRASAACPRVQHQGARAATGRSTTCPSPTATAAATSARLFAHEPARLEVVPAGHAGRGQARAQPCSRCIEWGLYGMQSLNPLPHGDMGLPSHVRARYHGAHVAEHRPRRSSPRRWCPERHHRYTEGEAAHWYGARAWPACHRADQFQRYQYPAWRAPAAST